MYSQAATAKALMPMVWH
ncbi:hypothetical protein ACNKHM_09470 [Shigella sonnei]